MLQSNLLDDMLYFLPYTKIQHTKKDNFHRLEEADLVPPDERETITFIFKQIDLKQIEKDKQLRDKA